VQPIFDAAWRRAALAGEGGAVDRLAEAVIQPLYQFCLHRVGCNSHLCEEVVQTVLLGAIRRLAKYDPARSGGDIFPWWSRMDRELLSLYAMLESEPFGEDVLVREETCGMVNATMAQLPPHYGRALEAKYVHGKTARQIAEDIGTTVKAVNSLLGRAREAFRATFLAATRNIPLQAVEAVRRQPPGN